MQSRRRFLQLLLEAGDLRVALLRQSVLRALQLLRKRLNIRADILQLSLQGRDFGLALLLLAAERFQFNGLRLRQALRVTQFGLDGCDLRILVRDLLLRHFQLG